MRLHTVDLNRTPPYEIVRGLVGALRATNRYIVTQVTAGGRAAFDEIQISGSKTATRLDVGAEEIFKNTFRTFGHGVFRNFLLLGEESLSGNFDVAAFGTPVVLVDALDGTSNCLNIRTHFASTGTVFDPAAPPGKRILANAIVLPGGRSYFEFSASPCVWMMDRSEERSVRGTTARECLTGAVIAGVGQSLTGLQSFASAAAHLGTAGAFYNIAGLPLVPQFLDVGPGAAGVDVVLELGGQLPHDSVPLICMALKGGARAVSPGGKTITTRELEGALLHPEGAKLRYVLAATEPLGREVVHLLTEKNKVAA